MRDISYILNYYSIPNEWLRNSKTYAWLRIRCGLTLVFTDCDVRTYIHSLTVDMYGWVFELIEFLIYCAEYDK